MKEIIEGKTKIVVETQDVVDRKMPIFYNPIMVLNRDFSLLVLSASGKMNMRLADPLAGSGIRSLRILKELNPDLVEKLLVNDIKPSFKDTFLKNLELNDLSDEKLFISCEDANLAMLSEGFFDFVEIDPFGSPNPFLDTAIRSLRREGILSVTATDTSALCGSYEKACIRKYWALPLRNELMHEFGARILIRKVQLLGSHHAKALMPIVTIATDHYIKIFFSVKHSKSACDDILKKHEFFNFEGSIKGPLWMGQINDKHFISNMIENSKNLEVSKKTKKLLNILLEESNIETPFFFDIHKVASDIKAVNIPKLDEFINTLVNKGFSASRTHFNITAIKTDAPRDVVLNAFKELVK